MQWYYTACWYKKQNYGLESIEFKWLYPSSLNFNLKQKSNVMKIK